MANGNVICEAMDMMLELETDKKDVETRLVCSDHTALPIQHVTRDVAVNHMKTKHW